MTASEICRAAHPVSPHLQLRDVWFIMSQLRERGLAVCLNPRHTTGKLYALTARGRKLAEQAFGRIGSRSWSMLGDYHAPAGSGREMRRKTRRVVLPCL
jgi:hypothetical protein